MPRMSNRTARYHAQQLHMLATRRGVFHDSHGTIDWNEALGHWVASIADEFGLWLVFVRSNGAVAKAEYTLLPRAQDYQRSDAWWLRSGSRR